MRLDWLLNPAAPYAALAIGLSLCVLLFVSLKRDLRAGEARWRKRVNTLEAELDAKTAALEERIAELAQISGLLVTPEPPRSGFNLTKRSQVLQMNRRGTAAAEIAEALALPQNEVDLLLKVQRIVLSSVNSQATRTASL